MLVFGVASLSKAQSNYVTEKDKSAAYEKCIQKGYTSLVGKTFIAEPENGLYDDRGQEGSLKPGWKSPFLMQLTEKVWRNT